MNGRRVATKTSYYGTASALAVLFCFPLAWSAWASVHGQPGSGLPPGFGLGNYRRLVHYGEGLDRYLLNSFLVAAMVVTGTLLVSALGGYAFARFTFPGRNALFLAALAILMVPYPTILIPLYVLLDHLHLANSLIGLGFVQIMFQLPFGLFMMRNSFEAVPRELEESALVDGCTTLSALLRVLLRAVRPGLLTVGLFAFLASWNDFIAPLILLSDGSKFTLPVAVVNMQQRTFGAVDYGALQAGVVTLAIPCVLLFLGLQRYYVRGFMTGALRG